MPRRRRYLAAGAWHHVTTRGNNKGFCFLDDDDRRAFLNQLRRVIRRYGWRLHARCLLGTHYHLVVETPQPNLSDGRRDLNGEYARAFNAVHRRCDHVFGSRGRHRRARRRLAVDVDSIPTPFDRFADACPTTPTS